MRLTHLERMIDMLNEFSTDELMEELERRKKMEATVPVLNKNPYLGDLMSMASGIVDEVVNGTYHEDNDNATYMYEEVMTMFYGEKFWDWFNENTD